MMLHMGRKHIITEVMMENIRPLGDRQQQGEEAATS